MKVIDCVTYFDEPMLFEARTNILDKYVDVFLVIEARHTHSGKDKKLNFNINNYPGIKNKIIYLVIDDEPLDLIVGKILSSSQKRINSLKRINQSYNKALDYLKICSPDDIFILSDIDEIPNLEKLNIKKIDSKIILFKQKMFYYKFNLILKNFSWYGTRAFRKKNLTSIQWMRHVKAKKYGWWRIDVLWKKDKYINMRIIENGGLHFTQLKSPRDIYYKFLNDEHHDEFELNKITYSKVKDMIKKRYTIYSHFVDKRDWKNRWNNKIKLTKVSNKILPIFLLKNIKKYKNWLV
jgi:beta-1,4-mannosyl-glycoprotein beta-1,4-N-acetylglucosaminyltransferase